jgi:sulfate-transporting ATPase
METPMNEPSDKVEELDDVKPRQDEERKGVSVSLRNISHSFDAVNALMGISCDILAGERVGIIGNNGSGRSTLCDVIDGRIKPKVGEVLIDEKDVTTKSQLHRSRKFIRRLSSRDRLYRELSLEDNVLVGAPVAKGDGFISALLFPRLFHRELRNTARQIMEYCNVDFDAKRVSDLDYVGRRRLLLARMLMGNPKIMIFDEPCNNFDEETRAQFCQVILDYAETFSTTVFFVDHNIDVIKSTCQRAIVLEAGKLIADGDITSVIRNDDVRAQYLDPAVTA